MPDRCFWANQRMTIGTKAPTIDLGSVQNGVSTRTMGIVINAILRHRKIPYLPRNHGQTIILILPMTVEPVKNQPSCLERRP